MKKLLLVVLLVSILLLSVVGCGNKYSADWLQDAKDKAISGEKLTREEEIMVDGFYEWKAEQ